MRAAVTALNEHARIEADLNAGVASLYETSPVGCSAGEPPYLNSAVRVMTNLIPAELLAAALSIEESLGRVRREKWEQRVIDIDLLLCEDLVLDDTTVTLPHPRLHERLFVLEPLSEIAGDVVHPLLHVTIANLAADRRAQRTGERLLQIAGPDWLRVLRVRGRGIDPLQRVEKGVAQS